MKPSNSEVFEQIKDLDFVQGYAKEYAEVRQFNEDSIKVELWDEFGQCSVWLGFDDQFAIRDAFGNWREATAEECIQLRNGNLPGSMALIN
ncbi:hypothetical protein [Enterobacter roggenkampii]|uniref:hypothetical protein n=1 Tax=Enterobacter roggenkampii TaxID=1812935 RepID=UPI0039C26816